MSCVAVLELVDVRDQGRSDAEACSLMKPLGQGSPVFSSISPVEALNLLQEVAMALKKEVSLRSSICLLVSPSSALLQPIVESSSSSSFSMPAKGGSTHGVNDRLRQTLTVFQAIWLSDPYLGDSRLTAILGALTEDMIGH